MHVIRCHYEVEHNFAYVRQVIVSRTICIFNSKASGNSNNVLVGH